LMFQEKLHHLFTNVGPDLITVMVSSTTVAYFAAV